MKILLLLAFFFSVFCLQAQEKKKSAHKSTSFKINITPSTEFKLPNGELISYKKFQLLSLEGDYSIDFESLSPEKSYEIYPTKKNSKEEKKRILKHYKQKSNKTGGTIFKNEKGKVISYYEFKTLENTGKWIGGGKKDPDTGEFYLQLRKPNERDKKRKIHTEWKRKIIGTPAPKFEIIDMDGNRINSENTKGKVVFLNFWFTTCKPCIMEIPDLNKIYQKYKNNPDVVFASVSRNKKEKVLKFMEKHPIDMPVSTVSQKNITVFNINGFPTNIMIDKNGNYKKYVHMVSEGFEKYIEESLKQ